MGMGLLNIGVAVFTILAKKLISLSIKNHGRGFVPHTSLYNIDLGISVQVA